jgi:DNA-binding response OmpR family regulator
VRFSDADGFLKAAQDAPPSLAILDVMLPGSVDGLVAMKRLREIDSKNLLKVIQLSRKIPF